MRIFKVFVFSVWMSLGMNASLTYADGGDIQVNAPATSDFVLFSVVKIKTDRIVDFKKILLPYADQTRQEDGNVAYYAHQSPDDPSEFEMYEHWASDDARSSHLAASYTVQFFAQAGTMFEAGYPIRKKMIELK